MQVFTRLLTSFVLVHFLAGTAWAQVKPSASYSNEVVKMHFPHRTDVLVDLEKFDSKKLGLILLESEDRDAGERFLRTAPPGNYKVTVFYIIEADGTVKIAKTLAAGSRAVENGYRAVVLSAVYSPVQYDGQAIPIAAKREFNFSVSTEK